MNIIVISSQQIKETRQDGIVYVDAEGNEQFIDFEACYQRELAKQLDPEYLEQIKKGMSDGWLEEHIRFLKDPRSKYIGGRNVFGNSPSPITGIQIGPSLPYIEFYTDPVTVIEFPTRDELEQLRYQVERVFKWRTHDLA